MNYDARVEMEIAHLTQQAENRVHANRKRVSEATNPVSRFLGNRALMRSSFELESLQEEWDQIHAQRLVQGEAIGLEMGEA